MDRKHMYYDDLLLQLKKKHQMGHQTWQASPWLDLKIYKFFYQEGQSQKPTINRMGFLMYSK